MLPGRKIRRLLFRKSLTDRDPTMHRPVVEIGDSPPAHFCPCSECQKPSRRCDSIPAGALSIEVADRVFLAEECAQPTAVWEALADADLFGVRIDDHVGTPVA